MSTLILPDALIEEKTSLKNDINAVVEDAVNSVTLREDYFLVLHAKFEGENFVISQMVASLKIPPFCSNQQVFFVSPTKGIVELIWMVAPQKKGEKLKIELNEKGITNLQKKGAMPS